jgi:hypothetical protein
LIRKPLELPPEVAKAVVEDMRAYFAEPNAIERDEIAARQLHAPQVYNPPLRRKANPRRLDLGSSTIAEPRRAPPTPKQRCRGHGAPDTGGSDRQKRCGVERDFGLRAAATNHHAGTVIRFTSRAPGKWDVQSNQRGSIMPALLDYLYHEYYRARLAEMRKQLLLWPGRHEVPEQDCDVAHIDGADDRARRLGDTRSAEPAGLQLE